MQTACMSGAALRATWLGTAHVTWARWGVVCSQVSCRRGCRGMAALRRLASPPLAPPRGSALARCGPRATAAGRPAHRLPPPPSPPPSLSPSPALSPGRAPLATPLSARRRRRGWARGARPLSGGACLAAGAPGGRAGARPGAGAVAMIGASAGVVAFTCARVRCGVGPGGGVGAVVWASARFM